ncbi:Nitrobenzene nitroreductase [Methylobacterium crusticola]|uniref:Nitrobenzene nitroreductase n=1 Tax=Methylobacterium crusticola TaxID=1697972 RepID=A0ABQ4QT75_9HYPH|nr:nitroreductase [Methylobacterium crusticola]GJD47797.1 Nitrobenzene nitroreductase [Methylobacterium crusticola]
MTAKNAHRELDLAGMTQDAGAELTADAAVIDAVVNRRSIRRFRPTPIPAGVVTGILSAASRAPSGTNFQPWHVHAVTGATRERLSRAVLAAAEAGERSEEYAYSPSPVMEPYLSRKRQVGFDLYELYGIERGDYEGRKRAMLRNFEFFGAPVGLFFTMEACLLHGSWLDCGMFMQNVMIVARAYDLETCPQQAWCEFGRVVHEQLGIPDTHILLSGMALGHADPDAPENTLVSHREPVGSFTTFHD